MPELTLQLYSARNTPLHDALKIVADAGYTSVEAYADNFKDTAEFKTALASHGLKLASAHISLDELQSNIDETMPMLSSFGASHVVCPYLVPEQRPSDKSAWIALAQTLSKINETLSANGFTFAWHNHDFEFEALPGGEIPMQLLMDNAQNMHWEFDIGWVVRAGANVNQWLEQYASRVSAIHLKDVAAPGKCTDEDGWADVGHGVIDWSTLLGNIKKTPAKHFIVEHDNPSDLKRFAQNSLNSVNSWKW